MRKLLLLIAIVGIGFTANAQKNVFKVNPLGLVFGALDVSYERVLSEKSAIELGFAYSNFDVTGVSTKVSTNGYGVEGKYKFYFSSEKDAPRGWYGAPFLAYSVSSVDSDGIKGDANSFSAGALAGYQWVFGGGDSGFSLDLNFGAQYVSASTTGNINSVSIDGFLPRLGLSLGYAW
ncbi:DUF3575 domain-containing protein [Tenacibaculum ovolyticum]|uniref:DUF3575 domain-containing protein n=1 Tax=Tenacibaculum ovolyticum TaxID=104270 RepID=UPI003BAB0F10